VIKATLNVNKSEPMFLFSSNHHKIISDILPDSIAKIEGLKRKLKFGVDFDFVQFQDVKKNTVSDSFTFICMHVLSSK